MSTTTDQLNAIRDEISQRLTALNKDRHWLSAQTGASMHSINTVMAPKAPARLQLAKRLLAAVTAYEERTRDANHYPGTIRLPINEDLLYEAKTMTSYLNSLLNIEPTAIP